MTSGHAPGNAVSGARATLLTAGGPLTYFRLGDETRRLPMTIKILLENLLRNAGNGVVRDSEIEAMAHWRGSGQVESDFPFYPARVLLEDLTCVAAAVDVAAVRAA